MLFTQFRKSIFLAATVLQGTQRKKVLALYLRLEQPVLHLELLNQNIVDDK